MQFKTRKHEQLYIQYSGPFFIDLQGVSLNIRKKNFSWKLLFLYFTNNTRAAVVHLISKLGLPFWSQCVLFLYSTDRTSWCNKLDAVRLYASYRLNLLLLKGQIFVNRSIYCLYKNVYLLYFFCMKEKNRKF